ncbi:hypothetical protein OG895_46000 [Streptomyces sp. NBC_00201]|uniref:hypothetical protein n=1 Tax=unclassified Streptomyces TaxID=2593676 RepID=UPI00224DB8D5|nr:MULTISPECIES: hypothetical protein [unclassified Streptomyces]MCX5252390.1 hypothetical protein [Streptomyces sp. NBC_00201]MCX5290741.1 hypothetical protein [Streptomyces sp. NBC_00183]
MSGTELTITVSGGTTADARAVVRALEPAFGTAREGPPADEGVTVHTARFEHGPAAPAPAPAPESGPAATCHLSGAVTLTVQGTPQAVSTARETLLHTFTAQDQGSVSGDQEQEWQLLLEP